MAAAISFSASRICWHRLSFSASALSSALRDVFKQARGPEQLFFVDLPILMDCRPFAPDDADEENAASFFARWNTAMMTLTNSYEDLLQRIEDAVSAAFGTGDWAELRARSAAIGVYLSEPALVAFVQRAADETLERGKWLESLAAVVTGRPPFAWSDAEEKRFAPLLQPLAAAFSYSELLAFEKDTQAGKAGGNRFQFSLMPASARPIVMIARMV